MNEVRVEPNYDSNEFDVTVEYYIVGIDAHHNLLILRYNPLDNNALVNFSNVDFDQIKESIKDYLRANSNFTDYDFEGSNLSTIIDTLAYNTYINSYNANMVTNEVFLDDAHSEKM